ncbi:MAG: glycosyltransferase [Chitinophagaceae bacterium]|nr:glycosyltransferase [Chitinophagaceae bacterium]
MIRICGSLAKAGYNVILVGVQFNSSIPLQNQDFGQKRLNCVFTKGRAFYIEFNIRLFFFLLFKKMDCICAIDLDTILPCYIISYLKKIPRVYDAHELFCEMKEVVTRPNIYSFWKRIEKFSVPKFQHGYTVNEPIAEEFKKMYSVRYSVVRNFPFLEPLIIPGKNEKYILYQGAVNEGRSFETLIPAMTEVNSKLLICGDGNFMQQVKRLVIENNLEGKVIFKGKLPPGQLKEITRNAWVGLTLFENKGLSNYLSLANRFSDYIQAGIPQLCVDYPVYRSINSQYKVAILLNDLRPANISKALNGLLSDESCYNTLQKNCLAAREILNWQQEETGLFGFYKNIFEPGG